MNPFFPPPSHPSRASQSGQHGPDGPASGDPVHDGPRAEDRDGTDRGVHVLGPRSMREPENAVHRPSSDDHAIPGRGAILDGKYRIEGVIGQGGMAVVLSAMHLHLDERVAIKLMLPQWAEDPELVERFMQEGRAATKIRSEHVVRVHDVGLVFERPYLVMECLQGSDLDQLLAKRGKLPVETAIDYLLQACEAIAEAHACGIIHRDLKPANLFLTHRADGSPCMKVLDFGISKRMAGRGRAGSRETLPSLVMGSPHYMSPEQMQSSAAVDERSDLWALGAILHELVAGTPPFHGDTITALCATIMRDPPPPLTELRADVPRAVEAAVLRCLEKDPARRFANVAELAAALADLGSDSARASAVRIARVLEGQVELPYAQTLQAQMGATAGGSAAMTPRRHTPSASARPTPNAVHLLESEPRIPERKGTRALGYIAGAMALLAVGSGIGWMIVSRDRALRAAEHAEDVAAHVSAPATQAAIPPPPPALDGPAGTTSLTNGPAPMSAPTTTASAPDPSAPRIPTANVDALPKAPASSAPPSQAQPPAPSQPRVHRSHTRAAPRPTRTDLPEFPVPATKYVPSVGADDPSFATPAPAPAPSSASPAPSSDGEGLFEDRK